MLFPTCRCNYSVVLVHSFCGFSVDWMLSFVVLLFVWHSVQVLCVSFCNPHDIMSFIVYVWHFKSYQVTEADGTISLF